MKKIPFIIFFSIILLFVFVIMSYSQLVVSKFTNNSYDDFNPQMNDNGYVVWEGWDGTDYEIYLYNGSAIINISNNTYDDYNPQINNNGYVTWEGSDGPDYEIYLYNGATVIKITNNTYGDYNPRINNNGFIAWEGSDGPDYEIYLYNGSATLVKITNNTNGDYNPQINDNGFVVWEGWDGTDYEIYFYNSTTTTNISNNSSDDYNPQINNNGFVAWEGWDGTDYEIYLFKGTAITNISNNSYDDYNPLINNRGYVVWEGSDGPDTEIFYYYGTNITQVTKNPYNDTTPQINDKGNIVWSYYDGTDWEIFLSSTFSDVTVLSPNGGEALETGTIYTIRWGAPEEAVSFELIYSIDNGLTWTALAREYSERSFSWWVPAQPKNKTKCLIKVNAFDAEGILIGTDTSDGLFTIEVVRLESPNGEDLLISGGTYIITWTTYITKSPVSKVKLYYTQNGGTTWNIIKTLIGNPGSFSWSIPTVGKTKNNCKVKVELLDASGNKLGTDLSDSLFTIQLAP